MEVKMNKIKITIEAYGIKHSVELDDDATSHEIMRILVQMMRSMTYSDKSILESLKNEIEKFGGENETN
jgi:hypothetical protein